MNDFPDISAKERFNMICVSVGLQCRFIIEREAVEIDPATFTWEDLQAEREFDKSMRANRGVQRAAHVAIGLIGHFRTASQAHFVRIALAPRFLQDLVRRTQWKEADILMGHLLRTRHPYRLRDFVMENLINDDVMDIAARNNLPSLLRVMKASVEPSYRAEMDSYRALMTALWASTPAALETDGNQSPPNSPSIL